MAMQSTVDVPASFASGNIESDILPFCVERGLLSEIDPVISLIGEHFNTVGQPTFTVICHPDNAELYLRVGIVVLGEVSKIADAYDQYTFALLRSTPPYVRSALRLSLTIA